MPDIATTFPHKLRYHHLMVAVLIVLFAFSLRSVAIYQRATNDLSFVPQTGTDHHFYLETGKRILDGSYPVDTFYFHPGPSYTFAAIYTLTGNTDFVLATFVIALLDALTCGFIIGAGWLISNRAAGGYLAGMIYALYPVAIFYATTPLIAPMAAFFVSGFIFFTLWQQHRMTLWRTVITGIFVAILAIHRLNLAPLAGLYLLWLLLAAITWRKRIIHGVIFMLIIIAMIAPITYLNYRNSGDFVLIASTGATELYMGNNRDSAGRHSVTFAHQNIDLPYTEAIMRDARVAPEHFFGLFAYKFALFWSPLEPGNNLNFGTAQASSSVMGFPLSFPALAIGGILGLSFLWYQKRESAIFLALIVAWICFGFVLIFAFGRIRFPVVVPLSILSGTALVAVYTTFQQNEWQIVIKRHTFALITIVVLYGFSTWSLFPTPKLPAERTYTSLPPDATRLDMQFDDVTLVGWRLLDEWEHIQNGWIPIYESYAVELFWQLEQPTDISYNFFLAYIDDGQRYDAVDTPIGTVSFPNNTTDTWQPERIIGEIISLRLDDDVPQGRTAQIRAGVWYWDDAGLIVNVPSDSGEPNVLIQNIAMFNDAIIPDAPDLPVADVTFGNLIKLRGYDFAVNSTIGETISVPFYWEAINNITADYRLFIHVTDTDGTIISQADTRPVPHLHTYNWMTGYPLRHDVALPLPDTSGTYEIYVGLYNNDGRLSIDATDDRLFVGIITILE